MAIITQLLDFILHINVHLSALVAAYGLWIYAILFLIIFCETGLVFLPFLPGDSLLFAAGSLAAITDINIHLLALLLIIAAILGDTLNYWIGYKLGPKIFNKTDSRLFNQQYLQRAQDFYEKYGNKTIVLARFIPIIRTFAPFVAGIGRMRYPQFLAYNIFGAILWVCLFLYTSYFFGNLAIVQANFSLIVIAIIIVSVIPIGIEMLKQRRINKKTAKN